uniref:Major facilitator superfamily (MFS) profile domain-containing protein n=1 Tax=Globisporangium ultimum (strain ATCC 200006 / CBS 805.95 / DAOM BR144) TaxID=431595 RepID=K3X402_GLOUD
MAPPPATAGPRAPFIADSDARDTDLEKPLLASRVATAAPPRRRGVLKALFPELTSQGVIILLCLINLVNYLDRGIIPGAPEKFEHFISRTLHIDVTQQSLYLGILASAFIASYSVCTMVFGYLALTHRPFRTIAFGMSVWVLAVIVCGFAKYMESYYVLLFGRILSGVGEASFQCNATPFIDTHAPKEKRALYMGIFLASITVGTALGYVYGSSLAASSFGWSAAFFLEGALMVALILACLVCVPTELDVVPKDHSHQVDKKAGLESKSSRSFVAEWGAIFSDPTFALVVLGHAAYTFSLAALSVFSPVIFIGLGLFKTETQVSMVFGGIIVVTGTIGTPLGGIFVDRLLKRKAKDWRCYVSVASLFYFALIAETLALVMMLFTGVKYAFLGFLACCFLFLCALSPAETIAVMELFPASRRSMAIAANTLVIHALGDVPSPIILGWLKDTWAPRCGTVEIDGEAKLNPDCWKDRAGLRDVLLFAVLWLVWAVVLWGAALVVIKRIQRHKSSASTASRV